MLRALKLAFPDGELPFDDSLQRRMAWAKFVGLALFFRRNSACWDGEERDEGDIQEGFLAAIPLFKETMAGLDSANNSSTTLMAVEMATQVSSSTGHHGPSIIVRLVLDDQSCQWPKQGG